MAVEISAMLLLNLQNMETLDCNGLFYMNHNANV